MRLWGRVVTWWHGSETPPSADTQRARKRLDDVSRDDARVDRLAGEVRRQSNLGPTIGRALRTRRL